MKSFALLLFLVSCIACYADKAIEKDPILKLQKAESKRDRFYALSGAAKKHFREGDNVSAMRCAKELLTLSNNFQKDWNYGNAIHDSHMILGRIALSEGNLEKAIEHLLKSSSTPGSPQLNTFGPNLSLVKDLLDVNESASPVTYLNNIKSFWANKAYKPTPSGILHARNLNKIKKWVILIEGGETPDFGAHLLF